MQVPPTPTEDDEASIPIENVRDDPNLNNTVKTCRKAAKPTLPWDLAEGELNLMSPPAKKKRRLEEPLPTSRDQAARETASPDVSVGLPPDDVNADHLTDTQLNGAAPVTRRRWSSSEDGKLTSAITKCGKEFKTNWAAVAALVPGRTKIQCCHRWHASLDPSSGRASGRKGRWTGDEDSKLKEAVQTRGDKDWVAISALVPGRTKKQCNSRWKDVLDPSINRVNKRAGKWTEDEESKLKDAVQTHGDNDWKEISALVPGRTKLQCRKRWKEGLDPRIVLTGGSKGKWTAAEDRKLKDAVKTHRNKDWGAISLLVPGRTKKQCNSRWKDSLDPSIDREN
jgi:hypothetical protein